MSDTAVGYPNDSQSYVVTGSAAIKGRTCKLSSASGYGTVTPTTAADDADLVHGVFYQDAEVGERVLVILHGSCDAEVASAGVTIGGELTINAAGQFVAQADPQVTETVAISLEASRATVEGQPPYVKVRVLTAPRQLLVAAE